MRPVGMQVMNCVQASVAVLLFLVAGCSSISRVQPSAGFGAQDADATVRNADLSARFPTTIDEGAGGSNESAKPLLYLGAETEAPPPPSPEPNSGVRTASLEPIAVNGDGVEMNFENADVQTVAKTLLGDVLHLNFLVDPQIQGNVTLVSVGPVPRKDVLPAFESVLRMHNAAIVHDGKLVKIVPLTEANGHAAISVGAGEPGFGISVVPLRYVSATTVARTTENLLSKTGVIRVDKARNLLLIEGTASEREAAIDVISTFDVEWLKNQSVGVYPLKSTSPETMIQELERVFETGDDGPGQGIIHFQPISRMNAVMVVTKNPSFLKQTTAWVQRLDRSDRSGTTVRTYRLKYGNATQVAKILTDIFVTQRSGASGDTPTNQIAPGTATAESRLDSLDRRTQSGSTSGQSAGNATGAANQSNTRVSAAFETFSDQNNHVAEAGRGPATSPGGNSMRGVFQNVRITADTVNNAVVVYSNQEDYRLIERALRDFDRPRLQVAIEATVAEVTLTNELTYGVQYFLSSSKGSVALQSAQSTAQASAASTVQSAVQSTVLQQVTPGFNLLLGSASQPSSILSALSTITSVKVLSSPSIVVLDNQPALLQVGDQVPITTSTATVLSNSNLPVVNTIELRNTGVILKVLPHVNANGTVQLEVDQEISNVVNANSSQPTLTPTISERRVHSTVAVTSGQTVLLGGLISDNDQKTQSGIPGLSEIKVLGGLFGTTDNTKQRSEIIIFIKPQLVRNSVDARAVTEEFREKLESMKSTGSVVKGSDVVHGASATPSMQKP
jgi:general secretion pathway protein D